MYSSSLYHITTTTNTYTNTTAILVQIQIQILILILALTLTLARTKWQKPQNLPDIASRKMANLHLWSKPYAT